MVLWGAHVYNFDQLWMTIRIWTIHFWTCYIEVPCCGYSLLIWLVVLTILKNISQWEGSSHILCKIQNVPNHQPVIYCFKQPKWISPPKNWHHIDPFDASSCLPPLKPSWSWERAAALQVCLKWGHSQFSWTKHWECCEIFSRFIDQKGFVHRKGCHWSFTVMIQGELLGWHSFVRGGQIAKK